MGRRNHAHRVVAAVVQIMSVRTVYPRSIKAALGLATQVAIVAPPGEHEILFRCLRDARGI